MDIRDFKTDNKPLCRRTLRSEIRAVWYICTRNLRIDTRYLLNFLLSQIFWVGDISEIVLLGYASGSRAGFEEYAGIIDFVSFLVVGGALWAFWMVLISGIGGALREEQLSGTLEVNCICPIKRVDILIGYSLSYLIESTLWLPLYFILGSLIFGLTFNTTLPKIALALIGFFLSIIASHGFSFIVAGLVFKFKEPGILSTFLTHPLYYFSGAYFTIKAVPYAIRWISYLIPTSYSIDVLRTTLLGSKPFMPLLYELLILLTLAITLPILGLLLFSQLEKDALKKGDLATY